MKDTMSKFYLDAYPNDHYTAYMGARQTTRIDISVVGLIFLRQMARARRATARSL